MQGDLQLYPQLAQFFEESVSRLAPDFLRVLPEFALVVVPADGILQGVHRDILARFGRFIISVRHLKLDDALAERFYSTGLTIRGSKVAITSWWIKKRVFDWGTGALIIIIRQPGSRDLVNRLLTLKGASDPMRARPNSLRHKYRTPSKSFGLLHSSDDWLSMLYELTVLIGWPSVARLHKVKQDRIAIEWLRQYELPFGIQRVNAHKVLYSLKQRLSLELFQDAAERSVFSDLVQLYAEAVKLLGCNLPFRDERAVLGSLLERERTILSRFKPPSEDFERVIRWILLCALCDQCHFVKIEYAHLKALLLSVGIQLSQLEELLLESTLYFYEDALNVS